jgi:hypothetical protein
MARAETKSGGFMVSFSNLSGGGTLTILYSYPAEARADTNLTVKATIEVNHLSGLTLYLRNYYLSAIVSGPKSGAVVETVKGDTFLFEGSHWGPENISIPLTSHDLSLSPGETSSGNVSIQFFGDVWYYDYRTQSNFHLLERGGQTIGTIQITSQTQLTQNFLIPGGIAAILIGLAAVALLLRKTKLKRPTIEVS